MNIAYKLRESCRFSFGGDDDTLNEELVSTFSTRFGVFFHGLKQDWRDEILVVRRLI
jgi:hypothetical protein